jgi:hypothetical protein
VSVKVYVEGGGSHNSRLSAECRRGFKLFLEKAGMSGQMPRIVSCGGRREAYDDFCTALRSSGSNDSLFLLVDSEAAVASNDSPWMHLAKSDGWNKPAGAGDDAAHLMVQCMESWLIGDEAILAKYFGQGFHSNSLPQSRHAESLSKGEVLAALENATRATKKGRYRKGEHSFAILALIDP